ncbi:MAG: acyl carrier protein [Rhodospirillales bacterium]|nr:acyl carrier protein [Rhodospirillales bacterium]
MNSNLDTARGLLAYVLEIDLADVGPNARENEFETWDSLGHMRLVAAIEQHLGRTLSAREIVGLETVEGIAALLANFPRS